MFIIWVFSLDTFPFLFWLKEKELEEGRVIMMKLADLTCRLEPQALLSKCRCSLIECSSNNKPRTTNKQQQTTNNNAAKLPILEMSK